MEVAHAEYLAKGELVLPTAGATLTFKRGSSNGHHK